MQAGSQPAGYSRPLTTLRHYSSFDVLAQKVFVLDRPTSRLSKEYEDLRQAVIALNYEDPEGAKVALQRVPTEYENARRNGETSEWAEVSRKPDLIRSKHPEGKRGLTAALHAGHSPG